MIEPEKLPIITELNNLLIIYDSIVFLVFSLLLPIYIVLQQGSLKFYSVTLFSLYVLCSYSSYNIMVMPIHDYNIAIARNIIYHYKIFSFISVIDIVL